METTEHRIVIEAPPEVVYDRLHRFEDWPEFMEGFRKVERVEDNRLRVMTEADDGRQEEWEATIVSDIPNERIAWRAGDDGSRGVTVNIAPEQQGAVTRVTLVARVPEDDAIAQSAGAADLERLRDLIEGRRGVSPDRNAAWPATPAEVAEPPEEPPPAAEIAEPSVEPPQQPTEEPPAVG
jgi:uncharacterized membrane protein